MPAKKKPARKAAPKHVSVSDFEAFVAEVTEQIAHIEAIISNRLGFKPSEEPEDIIHTGGAAEEEPA